MGLQVRVISMHVKLYLCVAGTHVRVRPRVGHWGVKMPGPFFNPSPSLDLDQRIFHALA